MADDGEIQQPDAPAQQVRAVIAWLHAPHVLFSLRDTATVQVPGFVKSRCMVMMRRVQRSHLHKISHLVKWTCTFNSHWHIGDERDMYACAEPAM